jgi:hypothetical protein
MFLQEKLRSAGFFLMTVISSVALTLLVQAALPDHPASPPPAPPAPADDTTAYMNWSPDVLVSPESDYQVVSGSPAMLTLTLTHTLTNTTPVSQQIALLQHEISDLWSAYYLARAANQIADAETALRSNDVDEVEQVLITVDASLDRAYAHSAEQDKGPINEFRMQIGRIYEDVRVRPEGIDQHLRRLRQSMLSLVDKSD